MRVLRKIRYVTVMGQPPTHSAGSVNDPDSNELVAVCYHQLHLCNARLLNLSALLPHPEEALLRRLEG
jgi:hypothetical protein